MAKGVYAVIFTQKKDKKNTVLVEIPGMGILTEGFGMADAIDMARDAIGLKGIMEEDEGREIPEALAFDDVDIKKGEFYRKGESFVSMVDVDFTEYRRKMDNKMVRKNVTLPNWLCLEAEKAHINVSKTLQEALKEKLAVSK